MSPITEFVPSVNVRPGDVVILDESRTPYRLAGRDGDWIVFQELNGVDSSRAHVDDLVQRTERTTGSAANS